MNKLSKLITDMDYEELKLIKKDLDEGNLKNVIDKRIAEHEGKNEIICPVCHTIIPDADNNTFTMMFGERGFRKKATFCATDCLEYFLSHLKKMKQDSHNKGEVYGIN